MVLTYILFTIASRKDINIFICIENFSMHTIQVNLIKLRDVQNRALEISDPQTQKRGDPTPENTAKTEELFQQ
jgi:hypothetical protein